jgi:hypothetical protein
MQFPLEQAVATHVTRNVTLRRATQIRDPAAGTQGLKFSGLRTTFVARKTDASFRTSR